MDGHSRWGFFFLPISISFFVLFFSLFFYYFTVFRYVLCMGGFVRIGVILFPPHFSFYLPQDSILPFDRIHYSDLSILSMSTCIISY